MGALAAAHPEAARNTTLEEYFRWQYGLLWLPNLDTQEGEKKHERKHKQCDDYPISPLDSVRIAYSLDICPNGEAVNLRYMWYRPTVRPGIDRQHRE